MDAKHAEKFKQTLLAMQAELRAADAETADQRAPVELDQQTVGRLSRMDALQVQAMAKESSRRRAVQMLRITAALMRLEEGEYGFCTECGDEIAERRLEVDPTSPHCIGCASR